MASFYKNYIINIEYIKTFLKTLNWKELYFSTTDKTIIFEKITLLYIEYFSAMEEIYNKEISSAENIEIIKNQVIKYLKSECLKSKSIFLKNSPLITEENINLFLSKFDWISYSKTEDCALKNFEVVRVLYYNYLLDNISKDYNLLINHDLSNLYNFCKRYITLESNLFKLLRSASCYIYYSTNPSLNFAFENDPHALIYGNVPIEDSIITPGLQNLLLEKYQITKRNTIINKFLMSIIIEIEPNHIFITFLCFKLKF